MNAARLLFPALRWRQQTGFDHEVEVIRHALGLGVGGFIIFGGSVEEVRGLTDDLQKGSAQPLLIGADLERGAGQQFRGATPLPPLAALGWLDDISTTERAGELTAREARAAGVHWLYAPVADIDLEPRNPIVGSRSFGTKAEHVAQHVAAWIRGCQGGGAMACAKHFPGHGRTVGDSHAELPRVDASHEELTGNDLRPFVAAIEAGVDSIMTAHVAFPALDSSATASTLSEKIVTGMLRKNLGFDGIVVTDALNMTGVIEAGRGEAHAAVLALEAGCDALLYPSQLNAVISAVEDAIGVDLDEARVREALFRLERATTRMSTPAPDIIGTERDRGWALEIATRSVHVTRGEMLPEPKRIELITIDDDLGGPFPPPPRDVFAGALRERGVEVVEVDVPRTGNAIVALYCDIRAWKRRPGLSDDARARVRAAVDMRSETTVVLFGHTRLSHQIEATNIVCAWGGEALMQEAAAVYLTQNR